MISFVVAASNEKALANCAHTKFRRPMPTNGLPHPSGFPRIRYFSRANLSQMPDSPYFPPILLCGFAPFCGKNFFPRPHHCRNLLRFPMSVDLFKLPGKVAWITGGSKGLGLQMANALASVGANLLITSR